MRFEILVLRMLMLISRIIYLGHYRVTQDEFESLMKDAQIFIDIPNQVVMDDDYGGHTAACAFFLMAATAIVVAIIYLW